MKTSKSFFLLILLVFALSISHIRCTDTILGILAGLIKGNVSSANGSLALNETQVELSTGGGGDNLITYTTYTDRNGNYQFTNIPSGNYTIKFTKGSFLQTNNISLGSEEGLQIDANLQSEKRLGYFAGQRDNIQSIVKGLGYQLDSLTISSFSSYNTLKNYSIIFINSGDPAISPQFLNNSGIVEQYLDSGGKIYTSDWAIELLYSIDPDLCSGAGFNGDSQTVLIDITDSSLTTFLGRATATINFDSTSWNSPCEQQDTNIYIDYSRGTYEAFGGNVTISNNSLSFYRYFGQKGGRIVYTTFRNEPSVTQDVTNILKFYVYEL